MTSLTNRPEFLGVIEQALDNTNEGLTIADARIEDMPLVYVNKAFLRITGYSEEESLGRNCRFLQGPETDRDDVRRMSSALGVGKEITLELLNYRKDGSKFWNRLSLVPIVDEHSKLTHYVGLQSDISEFKEVVRQKEASHAMRATMETVNDIIFNYMSLLNHYRDQMEKELIDKRELLDDYDRSYKAALDKLNRLNDLRDFREKKYLGDVYGIDLDMFKQDED